MKKNKYTERTYCTNWLNLMYMNKWACFEATQILVRVVN